MTGENDREGFAAFMLRQRSRNIVDRQVLEAFEATPRHLFVSPEWRELAWSDRMLPIPCGEAIEGVDVQAAIISGMGLSNTSRVLEIGTGTGFTAAVMARLAARVLTLDRYQTLVKEARARVEAIGLSNIVIRQANGIHGLPAEGPFDRIIAWAAFPSMPRVFVDQLSSGGMMIAPIGPDDGVQTVVRLTKTGSRFEQTELGEVRLQPMMQGQAAYL